MKDKNSKKEYDKEYRKNNVEKIKEGRKRHYEANKLKIKEYKKTYHKENKQKIADKNRQWYLNNREYALKKSSEYSKEYYKLNKEKITQKINSPEHKAIKNARHSKRLKTDPIFAITCRLRSRLNNVLRSSKTLKNNPTLDYIGCSLEELKQHLESQFQEGMTWDNRKLWHIDHIRPCASFDLTDKDQIYQMMNYTNLQPLWAADNLKKHAKYIQ